MGRLKLALLGNALQAKAQDLMPFDLITLTLQDMDEDLFAHLTQDAEEPDRWECHGQRSRNRRTYNNDAGDPY